MSDPNANLPVVRSEPAGYRSVRQEGDQFSLLSFCTDAVADAIRRIPDELIDLSEGELKKKMAEKKRSPTGVDYALRASFWREFEKCMALGRTKITTTHIYVGICHERYFYAKFLHEDIKVAWLIQPMQVYQKECEAILHRGTERLWEMIDMRITDKKGVVNPRLGELLLKVIEKMENRVHGMAVQRQDVRKHSVNQTLPPPQRPPVVETESQLQARIRQLEAELGTQNGNHRIDAVVVDGEALPPADESAGRDDGAVAAVRVGVPGSVDGQDAADHDLSHQSGADREDQQRP